MSDVMEIQSHDVVSLDYCEYINHNRAFLLLVTGLDLWGVLVATGVVCIIYCTLVGTAQVKKYHILY